MANRGPRHGRYPSALILAAMLLALGLAPLGASSQRAQTYDGPLENVVLDWNLYLTDALVTVATATSPGAGQGPTVAVIHFAMVHGAIYDAVNAIDGGYQPYLGNVPQAPKSASKAAAVATAGHDVLVGIMAQVPTTATLTPEIVAGIVARIDGLRDATLAAALAADGQASVTAGVTIGKATAAAMLAERANDGRFGPYRFPNGTNPGQWRPVPETATDPAAWVAKVKPFALQSTSQFRTKGPDALTSDAYARDYNEVKEYGGKTGSARTPAQEALAQFYNNASHPVWMYNRAFRQIALDQDLTLVQQARLFAMLNVAGADALIGCWDDKAHWNFWRPSTAIQQGENDGNPRTVGDPAWVPLLANPPYPDHPSGYNCVTAAVFHAAKAYFGTDTMAFSLIKIEPNMPDVTRAYGRFSDVYKDTIDARVYTGVHFRAADVQGAELGVGVADWVVARHFQAAGAMPGLPNTGAGGADARLSAGGLALAVAGGLLVLARVLRRKPRAA